MKFLVGKAQSPRNFLALSFLVIFGLRLRQLIIISNIIITQQINLALRWPLRPEVINSVGRAPTPSSLIFLALSLGLFGPAPTQLVLLAEGPARFFLVLSLGLWGPDLILIRCAVGRVHPRPHIFCWTFWPSPLKRKKTILSRN